MTTLLIDADAIGFRAAASCEPTKIKPERESLDEAIYRATNLIHRICNTLAPEEYRLFLGGSENFRKTLYPDYKANRTQPKPVYLDSVRNLLIEEWEATVCAGYEADDGLGIAANEDTIIVGIDKDLKQIPGRHYNFVKDTSVEVSPEDAAIFFYTQMLTGDSSDNVRGIDGIGPVRAGRILSGLHPSRMESTVWDCWREAGRSEQEFYVTYCVLKICRSVEELNSIETILREAEGAPVTASSLQEHIRNFPWTY